MKSKLKIFLALIASVLCFGMAIACDEIDPPAHEHTYASEWSADATHHWHTATCEHTEEVADKEEHTLTETVITAPTYLAKGKAKKVCSCGYETAEYDLEKKAQETPVYTLPTDVEGYYGETLAEVELPEGFSFVDELTTELDEIGEKTFEVKYIAPNDTEGKYKAVEGLTITVLVNKSRPDYTVPTGLTAIYGALLSSVEFPELNNGEWAWENTDATTTVGSVGEQTFNAIFTPFDNGYATVTEEVTVEVTAKPLNSGIQTITSKVYTGSQITPEVVVRDGAVELVKDTDYTVSYGENLTVADGGSVTVVLKGNYSGTLNTTFEITAKPLNSGIQTITSKVYTGNAITPTVVVKDGEKTLVEGTDYNAPVFANNTDKGTATVTVVLKGNYTGTLTQQFTITQKSLNSGIQEIESQVYTGSKIEPTITVKDGEKTLVKDTDYTVSYGANLTVATGGSVTVTFKGNYTGSATATFTIAQRELDEDAIEAIATQIYSGSQITPAITVVYNGETLTEGEDYNAPTYGANLNASEGGSVTVNFIGNFKGTANKTFAITAYTLKASDLVLDEDEFTYNGQVQKPTATVASFLASGDYTLTNEGGTNAGTYKVILTAKGTNVTGGPIEASYTIAKVKVNAPTAANVSEFTYNGQAQTYALIDGDNYSVIDATATNADTYTAKAKLEDSSNYEWTDGTIADKTYEFIIKPYAITDADLTLSGSLTYNGQVQAITATVNSFFKTDDYTLTNAGGTNAGEYTVILTAKSGNLTGSVEKKYNIAPKTLDDSAIADITAVTYDGLAHEPSLTVKDGQKVLSLTTDYTVTYSDNTNAGTATATVTFKGNYTGEETVNFTINPKVITNATIEDIAVQTATGSALKPSVVVKDGETAISVNDYTVEYASNTNPGTAIVTVTFKGNYAGSTAVTKNFTISHKAINSSADWSLSTGGYQIPEGEYATASQDGKTVDIKAKTTSLYMQLRPQAIPVGAFELSATIKLNKNTSNNTYQSFDDKKNPAFGFFVKTTDTERTEYAVVIRRGNDDNTFTLNEYGTANVKINSDGGISSISSTTQIDKIKGDGIQLKLVYYNDKLYFSLDGSNEPFITYDLTGKKISILALRMWEADVTFSDISMTAFNPDKSYSGTVKGYEGDNAVAVNGATVKINSKGVALTATTDENGNFSVNGIPAGSATVVVNGGYRYKNKTITADLSENDLTAQNIELESKVISSVGANTTLSANGTTITTTSGNNGLGHGSIINPEFLNKGDFRLSAKIIYTNKGTNATKNGGLGFVIATKTDAGTMGAQILLKDNTGDNSTESGFYLTRYQRGKNTDLGFTVDEPKDNNEKYYDKDGNEQTNPYKKLSDVTTVDDIKTNGVLFEIEKIGTTWSIYLGGTKVHSYVREGTVEWIKTCNWNNYLGVYFDITVTYLS